MKITYEQSDVIAAMRAHIAAQGISLEGKSVDIKFTMRKGNAGILANVSIDAAAQLPDLSEDKAGRPALSVVVDNAPRAESHNKLADPMPAAAEVETTVVETAVATGTNDTSVSTDVEVVEVVDTPAGKKTTSLFN